MTTKIPIRNYKLPKKPRVFDVTVNENGEIIRYDLQNIKGTIYIDVYDVNEQIKDFLQKNIG